MKKVFLALVIIMATTVTSCKQIEATETTTADSTAVQVDSVKVDTTAADTTVEVPIKVK
jgi:outer membrane lipoprotein SlyB